MSALDRFYCIGLLVNFFIFLENLLLFREIIPGECFIMTESTIIYRKFLIAKFNKRIIDLWFFSKSLALKRVFECVAPKRAFWFLIAKFPKRDWTIDFWFSSKCVALKRAFKMCSSEKSLLLQRSICIQLHGLLGWWLLGALSEDGRCVWCSVLDWRWPKILWFHWSTPPLFLVLHKIVDNASTCARNSQMGWGQDFQQGSWAS